MKRILLLLGFLSIFIGAQAQFPVIIHGQVTDIVTGQGIPNHPVTVFTDSTNPMLFFYQTVYTNNQGNYTANCPLPFTGQVLFFVMTPDCNGVMQIITAIGSNSPIIANFQICGGVAPLNCTSSFTATISGLTVSFAGATNSPYPTVYNWSFGDSTFGSGQTITHSYAVAGNYIVTLVTIDSSGCASSFTSQLMLGNVFPCQALFTSTVASTSPSLIQFHDLSTPGGPASPIVTHAWSFGDGTGSNLPSPSHFYSTPGTYLVCLTITSGSPLGPLCTSTWCDSVIIGNVNPCTVNFSWQINGLTANFSTITPATTGNSYSWNFGDSTSGTGANPSHTYAQAGNYYVNLIMTGANGCVTTASHIVSVGALTNQQVYGTIITNSGAIGQGPMRVMLMGFNPGTGALVSDSTLSTATGSYTFSNVPPGIYILRAEPMPGSPAFLNFIPTYYLHAPHWGTATTISLGMAQNPYNINLIPVPGPGAGPAAAGGTVYNGGVKMSTKGEPVPDVEVILKNSQGNVLDLRYSDVSGQFDFTGIPYGTYEIYAEVPGLPTIPATITLSAANPLASNIAITVLSTGVVTSLENHPSEVIGLSIYPNPARGIFYVNPGFRDVTGMEMDIMDLSGRKVECARYSVVTSGSQLQIDAGMLGAGVYLLRMRMADGEEIQTKVILTE